MRTSVIALLGAACLFVVSPAVGAPPAEQPGKPVAAAGARRVATKRAVKRRHFVVRHASHSNSSAAISGAERGVKAEPPVKEAKGKELHAKSAKGIGRGRALIMKPAEPKPE